MHDSLVVCLGHGIFFSSRIVAVLFFSLINQFLGEVY